MIRQYNPETLSRRVWYTLHGTYLFDTKKVVVETQVVMNGHICGYDVLKIFVTGDPDFFLNCQYLEGSFEVDDEMEEIKVFDKHKQIVQRCCDLEELQDHLVAVEIVKIEEVKRRRRKNNEDYSDNSKAS